MRDNSAAVAAETISQPLPAARPRLLTPRESDDVWTKVLGRLRDSGAVAKYEFDLWFSGTQLVDDAGDVIIVATTGDENYIRSLRHHYKAKVDQALQEVGRPSAVIKFRTGADDAAGDPSAADSPLLVRLADVTPEPINWIWQGRIAAGKLNLIQGDAKVGKSYVVLDVASRVSAGLKWPDQSSNANRGAVLLMCAEDGLSDTIRTRVNLLGGDARQISSLRTRRDGKLITLADIETIATAARRTRARLLVMDPISAFVGNVDSHKDAAVHGMLLPLLQLAEDLGLAILATIHRSKANQRDAILASNGSTAFAAVARFVLQVSRDRTRPGRSVLYGVGGNIGGLPPALFFTVKPDGRLAWDRQPLVEYNPNRLAVDLDGGSDDPVDDLEAQDVLRQLVKDRKGGPFTSTDAYAAGDEYRLSPRSMRGARIKLGLLKKRIGGRHGKVYWFDPTVKERLRDVRL